jgi:creatinine amidohydrolase
MDHSQLLNDVRSHRLELMHPDDIVAERSRAPIAYIPVGPLEWHGPHLPYGTDMLHAHWLALGAVSKTGGVVLPPLPLGTETLIGPKRERHRGFEGNERIVGMDFPGFNLPSLYNEESAFGIIIQDLVRLFKQQEYKVVAIINGHGGQNHYVTLMRIAREQSEPGKCVVLHAFGLREHHDYRGGHAEKGETAFMMAFEPETVNLPGLPAMPTPLKSMEFGVLDQLTCMGKPTEDFTVRPEQDPRSATAEEGKADYDIDVGLIADLVTKSLTTLSPQVFPWF